MNIFQHFFAYLRLREAVRKADKAHSKTGERYYVMPSFGSRQLLVMDRKNFRLLKQKHYIKLQAMVSNLVVESFYFTPYRNGSGWLNESDRRHKVRQYFAWYNSELRKARQARKSKKK